MSNLELKLNETIQPESRFIPSAVFDNNQSSNSAREQAFILGELFYKASEKHNQLEFKLSAVSAVFILVGVIAILWGTISGLKSDIIVGGLILIILAILFLIYGFYIDKPMKLISLSKIFTVNHIIPFDSALIIDGCDVVPDQTLQYNDIPLDEIISLSQELPSLPITFDKEQRLLSVMQEKKRLLKDIRKYSLLTPALLKNDAYTQAILECLQISQLGQPDFGILKLKVDYQTSLNHTRKIRALLGLNESVSLINKDIEFMQEKVAPFMQSNENCLSNIDAHFGQVIKLLNNRFFSGTNIHEDPILDSQYGYGIIHHNYHIRVGSGFDDPNTLNPVQNVIDVFDKGIRDTISTIVESKNNEIMGIKRACEDKVQLINRTSDSQINQLKYQITEKYSEISGLSSQVNMHERIANSYLISARRDDNEANRFKTDAQNEYSKARNIQSQNYNRDHANQQFASDVSSYESRGIAFDNQAHQYKIRAKENRDKAESEYEQAKTKKQQIKNIEKQIARFESDVSTLEAHKNSDIIDIKRKAKQEIELKQRELEEQIKKSRAHIEPIIEARDVIIDMMERVVRDIIPSERDHHKSPFKNRLDTIKNLLNHNLSEMQIHLKERSKVLEQIDSIRIDIPINNSISIKIPYWIACLEGKRGKEYAILPLQRSRKPLEPLKGRKIVSILEPLFQSLDSSKQYLQKRNLIEESASYSIYPGKLASDLSHAIDDISKSGYLSKSIAKRIKREYHIEGGT